MCLSLQPTKCLATGTAKPANVQSILWQGQEAGWYFGSWEGLGGIPGKTGKEVEAGRTNPEHFPLSHQEPPSCISGFLKCGWQAGRQALSKLSLVGRALQGTEASQAGLGTGLSRMQLVVDTFSADGDQCVMLSGWPGLGPGSVCLSWQE
jgi:hypothetical protein